MNRINYEQTGGFPLDTTNLNFLQNCFRLLNAFGDLAGNKAIISGCNAIGTSISDGVVYINGEIFEFRGGTLGTSVIIKEEAVSGTFEDGSFKPIEITRYATFGSSTPEKTFAWADFRRFDNLIENATKNADFEARITALETKKSPIPIGLIAIWGKPDTEPIPEGWQECTDLRGRFPLGWNPDYDYQTYFMNTDAEDYHLDEIGYEGGERSHKLSVDEMPRHSHTFSQSADAKDNRVSNQISTDPEARKGMGQTDETGGNQPHNNMPPYRIIRFIEFVGF